MIIKVDKSFQKDTARIKQAPLKQAIIKILQRIQEVNNLSEIPNCKKIKGGKDFYRIRLKDYRIGLVCKENEVRLIRFLHRKDIYKFFP